MEHTTKIDYYCLTCAHWRRDPNQADVGKCWLVVSDVPAAYRFQYEVCNGYLYGENRRPYKLSKPTDAERQRELRAVKAGPERVRRWRKYDPDHDDDQPADDQKTKKKEAKELPYYRQKQLEKKQRAYC